MSSQPNDMTVRLAEFLPGLQEKNSRVQRDFCLTFKPCAISWARRWARKRETQICDLQVEDIVNRAFHSILKKSPDLPYLMCVYCTTAIRFASTEVLREKWKRQEREREMADYEPTVGPATLSDEEEEVMDAAGLDDTEKAVVRSKVLDGMSWPKIGTKLDIKPYRAEQAFERGIRKLRRWYED